VARTTPRRRHAVAHLTLVLLRPAYRYSFSRDAYVLRVVGNAVGPVLVPRGTQDHLSGHTP
jgi:hypothetical protein